MPAFFLETARLILRAYQAEDWEWVHVYGSDPDFSKYELWGPNTVADTKSFVATMVEHAARTPRVSFEFAACLKDSGQLIGGCGLKCEAERSRVASLGWAITPEFQNQGFATEAARALVAYGFGALGLAVIYATCDARNGASVRVMEKLGMERVGELPRATKDQGASGSSYRYEFPATSHGLKA